MSATPYRTSQADDVLVSGVRQLVAEVASLPVADVSPHARFYDDLMVDSLQKLEIVVRIERGFGVRLTDVEAAGLGSVADAVTLLRDKGQCDR